MDKYDEEEDPQFDLFLAQKQKLLAMFSLGLTEEDEYFSLQNVKVDKDLFAFWGLILDDSSI